MSRTTIFAKFEAAEPRPARRPKVILGTRPAVKVNGIPIAEDEIGREVQYHPAASLDAAWVAAATALTVRELLRQRADALAIPAEAEAIRIEALLAAEVRTPEPDEATCRRWYEHNRAKLGGRDFAAARPIVADYLRETAWATACGQYVRVLLGAARIEGLDLDGAESPLLQ